MNILPIHTEEDYRAALQDVSALFDNEPERNSPEGNYFEAMIILIEAYETKQFPRYSPTEAFKFRMEHSGD
jgi:HTH-type transcriptional regulator/antitoxin HigA